MKIIEILAIIFAVISGASLSSIQIRRIIKGELPVAGFGAFKAAAEIKLDKFDKRMLLVAGVSFVLCIILAMVLVAHPY